MAALSGYLVDQLVEVVAVRAPEGAVHGQLAKQFAVRSESRYRRKLIYVTAGKLRRTDVRRQILVV